MRHHHSHPALRDAELASSAQAGDAASLGLILERHRPRLFATALHLLGYRADAEDAVQETCLIALRYVGGVRDSNAIVGWLHTVLRRVCLQHRRRRREVLTDVLPDIADDRATPEDRIERLELRDWIHEALQRLPEPLRVTAMLRYFGSYDSYDEVAAILGIPIGTVRSRLSEAKLKLADALLASAGLIDDDQRTRARDRERLWTELLVDIYRRGSSSGFVSQFPADVVITMPGGAVLSGRKHLAAEIESDLAAGVRMNPARVMSNDGIAIIEGGFVNPPEDPNHCPPGLALVLVGSGESTSRLHLHEEEHMPVVFGEMVSSVEEIVDACQRYGDRVRGTYRAHYRFDQSGMDPYTAPRLERPESLRDNPPDVIYPWEQIFVAAASCAGSDYPMLAAHFGLDLERVDFVVEGVFDPRGEFSGLAGFEGPADARHCFLSLHLRATLVSSSPRADLESLHDRVLSNNMVLGALRGIPQTRELVVLPAARGAEPALAGPAAR